MSKEKQIEEMNTHLNAWFGGLYHDGRLSNYLYSLGYRKQSENTVEVVRCRDCKNAKGNLISIDICHCLKYRDVRQGGDFCNYGEKKDKEVQTYENKNQT